MEISGDDDVDCLLLQLQTSPLSALSSLKTCLPHAKLRIQRSVTLLGRLLEHEDVEVAQSAEELLELAFRETEQQKFEGGCRYFEHRGIALEYWELEEDESKDLLFGNALWPCGQHLAKLLIDASMTTGADDGKVFPICPRIDGTSVMEFGAGVGLPSLACHACGASNVFFTDGEERLVDAARLHHGHLKGFEFQYLNWEAEAAKEAESAPYGFFDLILGSDIMLSTNKGHVCVPQLTGRWLRRSPAGRALFLSKVRKADAHLQAIVELENQQLRVRTFSLSKCLTLTPVTKHDISSCMHYDDQLLVAADWNMNS